MAKTTGLASITNAGGEMRMIDPRKIKVRDGWNFRDFNDKENAEHIESLYQSIKEVGVKEPLTVTYEKGVAWLDDGECRFRAAMLVIERDKIELKVPVKSEERYASELDRLINQRIRNSGKPFTVFEDAAYFKKLLSLGMQQQEIAKKCNVSAGRVSQILEYNTIGKVGRELVANGQASASLVMEVTKNEGSEAEKVLLNGLKASKGNKIKPEHVEGSVRVNVAKCLRDAIEYSHIDDEDDNMVIIKMPMEEWVKLKAAAKL